MSRDTWRSLATTCRLASAALAIAVLGCGRGDERKSAGSAGSAGSARTDSVSRTPVARSDTGAVIAPTPGFTSAQGTVPAQPAPAVAPVEVAARTAPPPPATLTRRMTAEEEAALRDLPAGPGHELVLANCLTCHAATMITQQHKDTAGWNKTVTQMIAWGAPVAKDQQTALVGYLVQHYPARAAGEPARAAP